MKTSLPLYSLLLSPVLLLAGDVLQVVNTNNITWTIFLQLSFLLFIGGLPAVNCLIHKSSISFRYVINGFLMVGAAAGLSMQVLFRAIILLRQADQGKAINALTDNSILPLTTMIPGICFPLGLLLLCIALFRLRTYQVWKILLLLTGAVLFPLGHALGHKVALVTGDLLLFMAWLSFSNDIYNRILPAGQNRIPHLMTKHTANS